MSPKDMADIYTRSISAMTDLLAASTRMATYMMFAGMEATRATTNYARQNSREIAKITSSTVRSLGSPQGRQLSGCKRAAMEEQQQQQHHHHQQHKAGLQAQVKRVEPKRQGKNR